MAVITNTILKIQSNTQPAENTATSVANADSMLFNLNKLVSGIHQELEKRDNGWYGGSDSGRYAFFAFFVAAIVIFVVMVCTVNIRRAKAGRAPFISSYLAPPNYYQSQTAYEGQTNTSLPTYTPNANPTQDVGYYDKNGIFIPSSTVPVDSNNNNDENTGRRDNNTGYIYNSNGNGNIEMVDTDISNTNSGSNPFNQSNDQSTSLPNAYTQTPNVYEAQNLSDMSYKRPAAPPPSRVYDNSTSAVGSSTDKTNDLPPYTAPETPDQSHYKS